MAPNTELVEFNTVANNENLCEDDEENWKQAKNNDILTKTSLLRAFILYDTCQKDLYTSSY